MDSEECSRVILLEFDRKTACQASYKSWQLLRGSTWRRGRMSHTFWHMVQENWCVQQPRSGRQAAARRREDSWERARKTKVSGKTGLGFGSASARKGDRGGKSAFFQNSEKQASLAGWRKLLSRLPDGRIPWKNKCLILIKVCLHSPWPESAGDEDSWGEESLGHLTDGLRARQSLKNETRKCNILILAAEKNAGHTFPPPQMPNGDYLLWRSIKGKLLPPVVFL